jgi:SAM-dependent methyltransferase
MNEKTDNSLYELLNLDDWVKLIIVDPLSKEPLRMDPNRNFFWSPYGRKYPVVDGIIDFRLLNNKTTKDQKIWREGQDQFELLSQTIAVCDLLPNYLAEIESVREVYQDIPVEGCCLDVGGHQGRLRQFLSSTQQYVSCDPFLNVFDNFDKQPNLLKAYPFLCDPLNFICCDAEFLPFRSSSFQTVHMRSVVDHFLNPELALNEAYRVLEPDGVLIIGSFVSGGKTWKQSLADRIKSLGKGALSAIGMPAGRDYHVWHPTYKDLAGLISECGFRITKVHWQKGYHDTVCYFQARKEPSLTRQSGKSGARTSAVK